jgi:hypothetical protein
MKEREPFKSLSCLKRLKKTCVVIATLAKKKHCIIEGWIHNIIEAKKIC